MIPKRIGRDDYGASGYLPADNGSILAAGTLGAGPANPYEANNRKGPDSDEQKISVFWRVFGGAIISIAALAAITLYNSLSSSIAELRSDLGRFNDARAELVKKDEFNNRSTSMWNRIQDLQALQGAVASVKEQCTLYSERSASGQRELKDAADSLRAGLTTLKEKLAAGELQLKSAEEDHRVFMQMQATISALQEKGAARDAQLKAGEEDRRALVKELQELRERLAKLEGVQAAKPATAAAKDRP